MNQKYWVCAYSKQYAAQAKVLKDSVKQHEPEYTFIDIVHTGDFKVASDKRLHKALDFLELGAKEVVISGADCWLFDQLVLDEDAETLFCAHTRELPAEEQVWTAMRGGLVNSDFQVWRQRSQGFLRRMLAAFNVESPKNDFEIEQSWLPLALSCTKGKLIDDPNIGIAYYNLHEREITSHARMIHFSGWDKNNPAQFTKYSCRALLPAEQTTLTFYAQLVKDAG